MVRIGAAVMGCASLPDKCEYREERFYEGWSSDSVVDRRLRPGVAGSMRSAGVHVLPRVLPRATQSGLPACTRRRHGATAGSGLFPSLLFAQSRVFAGGARAGQGSVET